MSTRHPRAAVTQRGAAVLVLLVLVGIILPLMLAASRREPSPQELARQRSLYALLHARDALIARAIKGRRDSFAGSDEPDYRPGSLPCPDVDDNGSADGSNCFAYLGRLPYKTLEIDDLRDGAGERLWYALSPAFRPAVHPLPGTPGQLRISASDEQVVAILIAPGTVVGAQTRRCDDAGTAAACARLVAGNYLEGRNAQAAISRLAPGSLIGFETRDESGRTDSSFNDLLLVITADMFMPAVERRVAGEAARCLLDDPGTASFPSGIELPLPAAGHWRRQDAVCAAKGPNGYVDAWRPLVRFERDADGRIRVHAGDATVCVDLRGQSC